MSVVRRASATPANLAAVAAGFAVLAIVVLGAVAALILATRDSVVSQPLPVAGAARPREDYRQVREEQSNILREYHWIDRNKGTARIPIERAMALILERGSLKPSGVDSSK